MKEAWNLVDDGQYVYTVWAGRHELPTMRMAYLISLYPIVEIPFLNVTFQKVQWHGTPPEVQEACDSGHRDRQQAQTHPHRGDKEPTKQ